MYNYKFAETPATHIDVFCDTDFAGCSVTRRSTSGGGALIGTGLVKHWSKTQTTIALSSGEAELGGISSGMAQAIGLCSLATDMNWPLRPRVHSDATAAICISRRRGLGKIRHLHTSDLWVQDKVKSGLVELEKVLGTENPGDVFTKYLDRSLLEKALGKMQVEFREGRPESAPATLGLQQP